MVKAITVSDISKKIKNLIENDLELATVYVEGEISNFSGSPSGHVYFSLKDEGAVIKCAMFKGYKDKLQFVPKDGMKVVVLAKVSVYAPQGYYQLQVIAMKQAGVGNLHEKLELLKQKLGNEGLFDPSLKKPIPFMPKKIGIVTSKTGAVIRDIINVSTRRNPNVNLTLMPVSVQGANAAPEIVEAIKYFNTENSVDVLIVGRGGGSIEDLWPFNEEIVARAIFESKIPIISAVGHETDWTIADYVADKRAPTPSAAAELAVQDVTKLKQLILKEQQMLNSSIDRKLKFEKLQIENLKNKLKDPIQIINEQRMKLDNIYNTFNNLIDNNIKGIKNILNTYNTKLEAYNVFKTLDRGYALVIKNGEYISDSTKLEKDDEITIKFKNDTKQAKLL